MAIGSLVFRIVSADAYRLTREKIGAITAYLQETLSGIRVVRSFGQEPRHVARFAALNDDNRDANMTTVNLNAAYFPAVELLSARWRPSGSCSSAAPRSIHGTTSSPACSSASSPR